MQRPPPCCTHLAALVPGTCRCHSDLLGSSAGPQWGEAAPCRQQYKSCRRSSHLPILLSKGINPMPFQPVMLVC